MNEQQIRMLAQSAADYARTGRDEQEIESLLAGQLQCYEMQGDVSKQSMKQIEQQAKALLGVSLGGGDSSDQALATFVAEQATVEESSDADLEWRISNYLNRRLALETVRVQVRAGTVLLRGSVKSWSLKWQCVECCRHVAGVVHVVDKLKVVVPTYVRKELPHKSSVAIPRRWPR